MRDTVSPGLCSQARLLVEGLSCIQLSCWPKGSYGNSQTIQADAKIEGCSLQTDSGSRCQGQHPHNSLNME